MPPLMGDMKKKKNEYWRSLDDLADTPEFREMVENEFPSRLPQFLSPVSRRGFLKVMGASMALLGLTGCRWPEEEIVPFAHRPDGVTPGVPRRYASSMELAGFGVPVVATSYDGRPVKVDGNPDHPMNLGGSDVAMQASVLELYDPDRSRSPRKDGKVATWGEFEAFAKEDFAGLKSKQGAGLRVLAEPSASRSLDDGRKVFEAEFPQSRWVVWAPFSRENETAGLERATGERIYARPDLEKAEVIVCLDDDLLGNHPGALRNTRDFARRRKAEDGTMNRLYVAESSLTVTGGMADERLAVASARAGHLVAGLAADEWKGPEEEWVAAARADLRAHRGRCVVTAGPEQPPEVHDLVYRLNHALGNVGKTVHYHAAPRDGGSLSELAKDIDAGRVDTLVILGGNPAHTAPADLDFAGKLAKVPTTIHLSLYVDETSALATWHLNAAHWLESWADVRAFDGRRGVVQPLIRPLYEGRNAIEVLALISGQKQLRGYDLVRGSWRIDELGETAWRKALHDGYAERPAPSVAPAPKGGPAKLSTGPEEGVEVVFRPDRKVGDGRHANNAWLQELPDPMTKITWGNAAMISPALAGELGVADGDHVEIGIGERSIEIPAVVAPGQAARSVTLFAGYGRLRGGRVADGAGTDVYPIRISGAPRIATAMVRKTAGMTKLARTENHHAIQPFAERAVTSRRKHLIREGTLAEYREDPEFAKEMHHTPALDQMFKSPVAYDGYKWGMSIDLSACTGCAACVVACQAENNVPVVGPDEVRNGREMHWLRVDRYFAGKKNDPKIRHQPIPCMQCENAPCEQVCPVAATQHSEEGLNDMVYNRCIGTRYCSNNCPYKVRRFNWFLNHKGETDIQKMVMNPDVTVRNRGVMEKCTYCVQRISRARIQAKNEDRRVGDGEVVPACAQACPAEAITFGDLNDPKSRVAKLHASARDYGLLEELNVRPRTRYLARLSNPASE